MSNMSSPSSRRAVGVLTLVLMLAVAAPAAAHPFVRGGEVPVDSLVPLTLAMAHGCGGESGEGSPTSEVSLEVPQWMRIVEVPAKEGWAIERETDADAEVGVVTWSNDDPVEPAPEFDLEVVVTGEPGQERFLKLFHGCVDGEHRWVGTPEEPAEDPAVRVTLAAGDPERPAPEAAEEPGAEGGDGTNGPAPIDDATTDDAPTGAPDPATAPDAEDDATEQDDTQSPDASEPATGGTDEPETGEEPASEAGTQADEADQEDQDPLAAEPAEDPDGGIGWFVALVVAILVAAGAIILLMRRRSPRREGDG